MTFQYDSDVVAVLTSIAVDLRSNNYESFASQLTLLGQFISSTSSDEPLRSELSNSQKVWNELVKIISERDIKFPTAEYIIPHVRLYRAVLLLIRNLIISAENQQAIGIEIVNDLDYFIDVFPHDNEFYSKTLLVYFQILANISHDTWEHGSNNKAMIVQVNSILHRLEDEILVLELPLVHFLVRLFQSKTEDETHHNLNLYNLLKINKNSVCDFLVKSFHQIEDFESLSLAQALLVDLLFELITHESFGHWLNIQQDSDNFIPWLKLNQLLITSKQDWNNYQITALLSWDYEFFVRYSEMSTKIIEEEKWDNKIEMISIISIDILSDLCKYEQAIQFLRHYDVITPLIKFLRVVHENIKPITIKDREQNSVQPKQKKYPHIKSLLIEVIAYISHESFETQEKVRELHGLELILSSCIIDENNPFVKERAIVCLKFLLANNLGNQKFVRDLEAKSSVDDEVLKDVGLEVEIENGKVSLKKNPTK
ncbi:hypothetical protein G9P44_002272 [Scheffersomyces stipitis]|nr:hypothetical protein G9P44_002272 [Scheffersomyces stipitis]